MRPTPPPVRVDRPPVGRGRRAGFPPFFLDRRPLRRPGRRGFGGKPAGGGGDSAGNRRKTGGDSAGIRRKTGGEPAGNSYGLFVWLRVLVHVGLVPAPKTLFFFFKI